MTIHDHQPARSAAQLGVAQRVIAVHEDHAEAERTVQALAEAGIPAGRTSIVGRGLTFADRGTGRLSTGEVTARGAVSGLIVGALTGWLLGLFDLVTSSVSTWWLVVNAAALGAVLGATIALVGYAATRGRRSFSTPPTLTASHYDVLVDADLADHAVRVLTER
ncbi:general stress protein [Nucisporomicrobium flavum]|uniref:general stress protein n=1 Tax=Nucisporomicrobium flavum TaxID=2785915 RepID=UPI0018F403EC|nr:general stress protein [Nucisporomicrobium flavum]